MNVKALALLVVGHLVTDINTGALPAYLPFIKEGLNLSYTMTASIILMFNMTSSVIQPIFGYLSDRWSIKWFLPVGPMVASLGLALLGMAPSYAWILTFVALSGLGQSGFHPEGFKTVSILSERRKATFISIFHLGGNLGHALGPILATLFFAYFGLKGSLLFIFPGIAITAVILAIPAWKVKEGLSSRIGPAPSSSPADRSPFFPMFLLILTVVLRSASRLGLLTFVPFYFIQTLHQDPLMVGKYLSIFLLTGTVGIAAGGLLADRYGYKKTVLASLGLSPLFLYLFLFTEGSLSLAFFSIAGLLLSSTQSITMAMGQSFMPRNVGMVSGLLMGLAMGIGGISTALLGWLADHRGVLFTMNLIFILPMLAFAAFLFIPYPHQRQIASPNSSLKP